VELMLGLRLGQVFRNIPAHHGVDHRAAAHPLNPAKAAREAAREAARDATERWTPPVLATVGHTGAGVDELLAALDRHFDYLERSGTLRHRRRQRLRERVVEAVERDIRTRLWSDADTVRWLDAQLDALESGERTPFAIADELVRRSTQLITRASP
jgi:LAO/AO transport system kinase